jgi:hypothetical protein
MIDCIEIPIIELTGGVFSYTYYASDLDFEMYTSIIPSLYNRPRSIRPYYFNLNPQLWSNGPFTPPPPSPYPSPSESSSPPSQSARHW